MATTANIARIFGCTAEQVRAGFERNAKQLEEMHAKALATGKRVNGYTAAELADAAVKARANAKAAE